MERPTAPAPAIATRIRCLSFPLAGRRARARRTPPRSAPDQFPGRPHPARRPLAAPSPAWAAEPRRAWPGRRFARAPLPPAHCSSRRPSPGSTRSRPAPPRRSDHATGVPYPRAGACAASGRRSSGRWPRSGCPAAGTPRRAERFTGHPGGDHVGVVAAADGGERVSFLDPGLHQDMLVETDPADLPALERGTQFAERIPVLVDDRDRMALVLKDVRECGSDSPASHDHDVHGGLSGQYGARPRYSPPPCSETAGRPPYWGSPAGVEFRGYSLDPGGGRAAWNLCPGPRGRRMWLPVLRLPVGRTSSTWWSARSRTAAGAWTGPTLRPPPTSPPRAEGAWCSSGTRCRASECWPGSPTRPPGSPGLTRYRFWTPPRTASNPAARTPGLTAAVAATGSTPASTRSAVSRRP